MKEGESKFLSTTGTGCYDRVRCHKVVTEAVIINPLRKISFNYDDGMEEEAAAH
jgi:hypothetical protein